GRPAGGLAAGGFAGPPGTVGGAAGLGETGGAGAGAGGGGAAVSAAVTTLLKATNNTWAAAAIGSQTAGPLELASGKAVMSIGGFNGGDASPTLAQFQQYVAAGKIHYFIGGVGGGAGPGGGGGGQGSQITAWVAAHFTATTVGATTVYDLTRSHS
ncbi:MAG: glycosyl transferase, partial [Actinomycetota bacterium]|nr:glycosyl transferase [Actinomycetota bacterium]